MSVVAAETALKCDVLVLRRVHPAAQLIGGLPQRWHVRPSLAEVVGTCSQRPLANFEDVTYLGPDA